MFAQIYMFLAKANHISVLQLFVLVRHISGQSKNFLSRSTGLKNRPLLLCSLKVIPLHFLESAPFSFFGSSPSKKSAPCSPALRVPLFSFHKVAPLPSFLESTPAFLPWEDLCSPLLPLLSFLEGATPLALLPWRCHSPCSPSLKSSPHCSTSLKVPLPLLSFL